MTQTTETPAGRWRQKPVVVEAHQLIDDLRNHTKIATWITVNGGDVDVPFAEPYLYIETIEGRMRADIGDWIIKGVQGEFYRVKPDIFEATYEPACRVCDGSGNLTVPDGDGESASEQACPDPIHDRQPAADPDSQQRYIDQLHDLVRDMLQSFPDTADEQEWRDRAGRLYVHDHDGQPYHAYTEDDDESEDPEAAYSEPPRADPSGHDPHQFPTLAELGGEKFADYPSEAGL